MRGTVLVTRTTIITHQAARPITTITKSAMGIVQETTGTAHQVTDQACER